MGVRARARQPAGMTSDPLLPGDDAYMGPRRLTRSSTDRMLGGVAGGLGAYFGVDAMLFRVAFVVSFVFGGVGLLAYVALLAFVPTEDGESFMAGRSRAASIGLTVALVVAAVSFLGPPAFVLGPGLLACAILVVLGLLLWQALGGSVRDDPGRTAARAGLAALILVAALGAGTAVALAAALGGGPVVAAGAIVAGLGLRAAGLLGGPRWLILPVIVLVVPLAIVSAAHIDVRGGVGDRRYRVVDATRLQPLYRVGMGRIELDVSQMPVPEAGKTVNVKVGFGEAIVHVPGDACVSTRAHFGAGESVLLGRRKGGADLTVVQTVPADTPGVLHVNANVGFGGLTVERDKPFSQPVGCA
jgi:phage shock protein PspC (stress-responsive transcriptional regulator)